MEAMIESNVPVPISESVSTRLEAMQIGDSMLFNEDERNYVAKEASVIKRHAKKQFTISKKGQAPGKCRVWRIA